MEKGLRTGQRTVPCPIRKNIWWIIIAAILLVMICAFYIFVLHPILGTPFMDFREFRGEEYYTTGEFLKFENGPLFQEMLCSFPFLKDCEVTDFYYSDNRWKDSFVYGKKPDVFGVMLDSGENFTRIKAQIEAEGIYDLTLNSWDQEKAMDVYAMAQRSDDESIDYVFIVGRETDYLSFIMVTDLTNDEQTRTYSTLIDVIYFWSTLPFDVAVRIE